MRKERYSVVQIASALQQHEAGMSSADVSRKQGIAGEVS